MFLAWIIGRHELAAIVTDPPVEHLAGLTAIVVFSFVFYMVFARFREQACVLACPYGRVMSSLIDARTVTVTYDRLRGEPRSRLLRGSGAPQAAGDCIDCHQCVTVCPTGIDIRDGIQLECVNCTACIDACDAVMTRISRPTGLIRLTSEAALHQRQRWLTARSAGYGAVWLLLVAAVVVAIASRPDLDVLILRSPGTVYTAVQGGGLANFYDVQVLNNTPQAAGFTIEALEPRGATLAVLGRLGQVEPYGAVKGRLLLQVPAASLTATSTAVRFVVRTATGSVHVIDSTFLGPAHR